MILERDLQLLGKAECKKQCLILYKMGEMTQTSTQGHRAGHPSAMQQCKALSILNFSRQL